MERYLEIIENSENSFIAKVRPRLPSPTKNKMYSRVKFYRKDVYRLCPEIDRDREVGIGDRLPYDSEALIDLLEENLSGRKKEGSDMIMDILSEQDLEMVDILEDDEIEDETS